MYQAFANADDSLRPSNTFQNVVPKSLHRILTTLYFPRVMLSVNRIIRHLAYRLAICEGAVGQNIHSARWFCSLLPPGSLENLMLLYLSVIESCSVDII